MSRSVKKGPFVDAHLIKKVEAMTRTFKGHAADKKAKR